MTKTTTQIDLLDAATTYELASTVLTLLTRYLHSPTPARATELAKALRGYQVRWIEANTPDVHGVFDPMHLSPHLLGQLLTLANRCVDGSAWDDITEHDVTPEMRDMLVRAFREGGSGE